MSNSIFGADFGDPALDMAYDLMMLDMIEKDEKEIALRKLYGKEEEDVPDEK